MKRNESSRLGELQAEGNLGNERSRSSDSSNREKMRSHTSEGRMRERSREREDREREEWRPADVTDEGGIGGSER